MLFENLNFSPVGGAVEAEHAISWRTWGPEAFDAAKAEDKLVLVDSGATWCHWCHVMDRVTYEDPEVVDYINEHFVAVRIDRDRLPEVDARLQRSVPVIHSAGGGWPLTALLTPEGRVLFKATFLPPRGGAAYGVPVGIIELLQQVDRLWRSRRDDITAAAGDVETEVRKHERAAWSQRGQLRAELVSEIAGGIMTENDDRHGGFGDAPKFFHTPALDLLLGEAWRGNSLAARIVTTTLDRMVRGGVYDQVGGGFHRYSVDARWHVPHFEKMAYDNAALMALYANAAAFTGREDFVRVAREIAAWAQDVLGGALGKGFYASQDADVGLDDDGDYFTWTLEEVQAVLGQAAQPVIEYYAIDEAGDIHGRPGRNVLHVPRNAAQVARMLEMSEAELRIIVDEGRRMLLEARRERTAPAVDKTVFADQNGMMIDAFLTAWERLGEESLKTTALRNLDAVMRSLRDDRGVFGHYSENGKLRGLGLLGDQAWMIRALLHAFAATGEPRYLDAAQDAAKYVLDELRGDDGSLVTAPADVATAGPQHDQPRRDWADAPEANAASVAAACLVTLARLTGNDKYAEIARLSLESFAGGVRRDSGLFLATYASAVEHALNGPRTLTVLGSGEDETTVALADAARRQYVPLGIALVLDPHNAAHRGILGRLAEGKAAASRAAAVHVCGGKECLPPAKTAQEIAERVKSMADRK